jgi:hypothetical protein
LSLKHTAFFSCFQHSAKLCFSKKYCDGHNLICSTEHNIDGDCLTCKESSGSEIQVLISKYSIPRDDSFSGQSARGIVCPPLSILPWKYWLD